MELFCYILDMLKVQTIEKKKLYKILLFKKKQI